MNTTTSASHERAVVIGSGFGGLSAAVRLRARGYDVTVVEALDQPGGRARVFERDGCSYDAGPTVITAPHLIDELFTLVGRNPRDYFELLPVDPWYRVEFPSGERFDYVGDEERILSQIKEMSPRDVDGYRRMAKHMERIFDVGYTGLADQPFDRFGDMMKVVPDMMKLQSYKSVYNLVASYLKDDRLRQVFTFQPLLVGGNPFSTTSIYSLIHWLERKWGVWFAKGGTAAIVRALVKLLNELGVEVKTSAPVARIDVDGATGKVRGVELESGERLEADVVVSNADPSMTYSKMIAPEHRKRHTDAQVNRVRGSMSLYVAYFHTDKVFEDIKHHTIVLGPRYKGLLDEIFNKKTLADDFSLYLHRPTATDPALAPAGKDCWYLLSPVPNQRSGLDWEQEHEAYGEKILKSLDRLAPGILQQRQGLLPHRSPHLRRRPAHQGRRRLWPRARAHSERLVPLPQPLSRRRQPLLRGRRHPPRRGGARGVVVVEGVGADHADAGEPPRPALGPPRGRGRPLPGRLRWWPTRHRFGIEGGRWSPRRRPLPIPSPRRRRRMKIPPPSSLATARASASPAPFSPRPSSATPPSSTLSAARWTTPSTKPPPSRQPAPPPTTSSGSSSKRPRPDQRWPASSTSAARTTSTSASPRSSCGGCRGTPNPRSSSTTTPPCSAIATASPAPSAG